MTKIQVHYREADGTKGIINYFSADNAEASAPGSRSAVRSALLAKAAKFAAEWARIFPNTKFIVCEV